MARIGRNAQNLILGTVLSLSSTAALANANCNVEAEKAVRAVYAITDQIISTISAQYVATKASKLLGEEVNTYSVLLDVNGGSGVYSVETTPTLGCLVSKVELEQFD